MPILQYRNANFSAQQALEGARLLAALASRIDVFYAAEDGECALQARVSPELFADLSAWCAGEEDDEPEPVEDDARDLAPVTADEPARRLIDETPDAVPLAPPLAECRLALARVAGACPAFARGLCTRSACPAAILAGKAEGEPEASNVVPLKPRRPPAPLSRRLGQIAAVLAVALFQPGVVMKAGTLDLNGNGVFDVEDLGGLFGLDALASASDPRAYTVAGAPWRPGMMIRRKVSIGTRTLDMQFELGERGHLIARHEYIGGEEMPPRPPVETAKCGLCGPGVLRHL